MIIKKFEEYHLINEKRSDHIEDIINMREVIIKHCMKLYLYPNSDYVYHWMKELRSFFKSVFRYKDKKPFEYKVYMNCLSYNNPHEYDEELHETYHDLFDDVITNNTILVIERDDLITFVRLYIILLGNTIPLLQNKNFDEKTFFDLLEETFELSI